MELYEASNQWAKRPIDETYWGLTDALVAAREMKNLSVERTVNYQDLKVIASSDSEIEVIRTEGNGAVPTYSATQQLCARAKVPYSLISRQPGNLASDNLNWGLRKNRNDMNDHAVLLLYKAKNRLMLRAMTSQVYNRLWNSDFLELLIKKLEIDWVVPPARPSAKRVNDPRIRPATPEDVLSLTGIMSVQVGDLIGPAGVYVSDKDMFIFMWNKNPIGGPSGPLHKFIMCWNNEIGTGSWGATFGYADHVCGNHIIWGAEGVREIRVRHVGKQSYIGGISKLRMELKEYDDESSSGAESKLKKAASYELGGTMEETVQKLMEYVGKKRIKNITQPRLEAAYEHAEQVGRYGSPNTPWAISSALTELSQESEHADTRARLDQAAGKILDIAF